MTQAQLDEAIATSYDNGIYTPTGADGGALRYIMVNVNGQWYNASITLDHDIAQIRRIWELREVTSGNETTKKLYDFTKQYYSARL